MVDTHGRDDTFRVVARTQSKQTRTAASKQTPAKAGNQIALRVDNALLKAIDEELGRLREERPGATIHRSDVVRELCWRSLRGGRK